MATMQMRVRPEDLSQVPTGAERIPEPGILVIFGASGDLTKRKLLPALFHLFQANLLPKQFAIVGVARRPLGDETCQLAFRRKRSFREDKYVVAVVESLAGVSKAGLEVALPPPCLGSDR